MTSRDHSQDASPLGSGHAGILERLPDYAMQVLQGQLPDGGWQEVVGHLVTCAECRAEFELLCSLLRETAAGTLAPAPAHSDPDLSFLADAPPAEKVVAGPAEPEPLARPAQLVEKARLVMIELTASLLSSVSGPRLAGSFRNSPNGQRPNPPQPAPPGSSWKYQHPYDQQAALGVAIEAVVTDPQRQLCRILVTVDDAQDPLPEHESEVSLHYAAVTRTELTDMGTIAFADIPLAALDQLRITIQKPPKP